MSAYSGGTVQLLNSEFQEGMKIKCVMSFVSTECLVIIAF